MTITILLTEYVGTISEKSRYLLPKPSDGGTAALLLLEQLATYSCKGWHLQALENNGRNWMMSKENSFYQLKLVMVP